MSERVTIPERPKRLIREEPVFTMMLKAWRPILPRPFRDYVLDFLMDVETLLRSREYMVGTVAGIISNLVLSPIYSLVSEISGAVVQKLRRVRRR